MVDVWIPKLRETIDPNDGSASIMFESTLPGGYRLVGTVDRPDGTIDDLGQNADGNFLLFRRKDKLGGVYDSSHEKGRALAPEDLRGFGLFAHHSVELVEDVSGDGQYGPLCRTNLIGDY